MFRKNKKNNETNFIDSNKIETNGRIDKRTIEEADDIIAELSKKAASNKKVVKDTGEAKFGVFEETMPSEELKKVPPTKPFTPIFDNQVEEESPYNKETNDFYKEKLESLDEEPLPSIKVNDKETSKPVKVEKRKKSKILPFIIFGTILVLTIGSIIFYMFFMNTENSTTIEQPNNNIGNSPISEPVENNNTSNFSAQIIPLSDPNTATLNDSFEYINHFNEGIERYFNGYDVDGNHIKGIIEIVTTTDNNYRESELLNHKIAIETDIKNLENYRQVFLNHNAVDLYNSIVERYNNLYFLISGIKNAMTEEALYDFVNEKIQAENTLNKNTTALLIEYLSQNGIDYDYNEETGSISYIPNSQNTTPVQNDVSNDAIENNTSNDTTTNNEAVEW